MSLLGDITTTTTVSTMTFIEMENVLHSIDSHIDSQPNKSTSQLGQESTTTIIIQEKQQQLDVNYPLQNISKQKKHFIIKTKCCQLELTCDRIASFLLMLLAIVSLFVLAVLSTGTIFLRTNTENLTYNHVTIISEKLLEMNSNYKIMMESKIEALLMREVNERMNDMIKSYQSLIIDIPYYGNTPQYSRSSVVPVITGYFNSLKKNHDYLYQQLVDGKRDVNFFTVTYQPSLMNFTSSMDLALILADKAASNEDGFMDIDSKVGLVLAWLVLFIIIPSVVVILIKSAVNDNRFMDKLKKADARIVLETISDARFQLEFKELCKTHHETAKYMFLERVQLFMEIGQRIFTLQDDIEEGVNVEMSKNMLIEIDELEAKKFELAFEIITEYLDFDSDTFLGYKLIGGKRVIEKVKKIFDSQSMNLPENLFKSIQVNVSMSLLPIHRLFKSQQRRQREERRVKIIQKQVNTSK